MMRRCFTVQTHSDSVTRQKVLGISLRPLSLVFAILLAALFVFILFALHTVSGRIHALDNAIGKYIICKQSSELIKESSAYLTEQARLFAITHREEFALAYLHELEVDRRQQLAFESVELVCPEKGFALQRLKIALEQEEGLADMELYAIRLVYEIIGAGALPERIKAIPLREPDKAASSEQLQESAVNALFGEGYLIYKGRVTENCRLTIEAIEQQIRDELNLDSDELYASARKQNLLLFTLIVLNIVISIVFFYLIILPLKKFMFALHNGERLCETGSRECRELAQSYNALYELQSQNDRALLQNAEYDPLTGTLSQASFEQLCHATSERKQPIALLLIDMDNFAFINESYGHEGGNTALKEVARVLLETFRTDDYIARIGGDEFAAILPDFKKSAASIIKQKILAVNERLVNIQDNIKPVSISVGVAFSMNGYSEDLFKSADRALYIVKEKGKRGCEIYDDSAAGN